MAPESPEGMGGFFQGMLGDLLRLLKSDAPLQWDLVRQLAEALATEGEGTSNVDPLERIRLEPLARLAEMQVADVSGMTTTPGGRPVALVAASRAEWTRASLESWRPVFDAVARTLVPLEAPARENQGLEADEQDELGAFLQQWAGALGPAMLSMQIGSMMGHLAREALGQYDLLLPRTDAEQIFVVPANVKAFAEDWELPHDDVILYLAVRDIALHTILSRPHVHKRLVDLVVAHAQSFRPDRHALEALLGGISPDALSDMHALGELLNDPDALAPLVDTPEQRIANAELETLTAAIVGYGQHLLDVVAERSIGARLPVREALARKRAERSQAQAGAEALLGLRLGADVYERGEAFVRGVLERDGASDLETLFVVEANLPTPAELAAPGLWLERIHLGAAPGEAEDLGQ